MIGGGFTGLSTALHLREAGVDVAIVEAMEPGWGASGRNNGQVIPTLSRPDPEDIIARHGAAGERFVGLLRDSASILFDRRAALSDPGRAGTGRLGAAGAFAGRIKIAERRVRQWSKFGAPVELLSRDQTREMLGSDAWFGGFWNKTGGHINPLALARGLARVVLERGGRIYARSPATRFERRNDRWVVKTAKGEISGRALIVATNAYTGEFSKSLMPDDRARSDAGAVLADGDAAAVRDGAQDHHSRPAGDVRHPRRTLFCALRRAQPPGHRRRRDRPRQQGGADQGSVSANACNGCGRRSAPVEFDYVWNGYVGMTTDFLPRIHRLGPDAYGWTGCNGRAVALSIALGDELSKAVRGVPENDLALPFTEPVPIVAHGLLRKLAPLMLMVYRRRDAREIG